MLLPKGLATVAYNNAVEAHQHHCSRVTGRAKSPSSFPEIMGMTPIPLCGCPKKGPPLTKVCRAEGRVKGRAQSLCDFKGQVSGPDPRIHTWSWPHNVSSSPSPNQVGLACDEPMMASLQIGPTHEQPKVRCLTPAPGQALDLTNVQSFPLQRS